MKIDGESPPRVSRDRRRQAAGVGLIKLQGNPRVALGRGFFPGGCRWGSDEAGDRNRILAWGNAVPFFVGTQGVGTIGLNLSYSGPHGRPLGDRDRLKRDGTSLEWFPFEGHGSAHLNRGRARTVATSQSQRPEQERREQGPKPSAKP